MCRRLTEDALAARETQFQASAASLDADDAFSRLLLGCALADAGDFLPRSELETAKKLAEEMRTSPKHWLSSSSSSRVEGDGARAR